jgi:hypothetical protein
MRIGGQARRLDSVPIPGKPRPFSGCGAGLSFSVRSNQRAASRIRIGAHAGAGLPRETPAPRAFNGIRTDLRCGLPTGSKIPVFRLSHIQNLTECQDTVKGFAEGKGIIFAPVCACFGPSTSKPDISIQAFSFRRSIR